MLESASAKANTPAMRLSRRIFTLASAAALGLPAFRVLAQEPAGRTILRSFDSAPFPHPSRAGGHDYGGTHYGVDHYGDGTVGIFVPPGYRAEAEVDYVVHFHGWNNDVAGVLNHYHLREQLTRSRRNAVLIVPQGPKDAPDSGDGKLELDANGLATLLRDVTAYLRGEELVRSTQIGRVVLTAHSGGYGGAGGSLTHGGMNAHISDVILFDSAYGYYDAFAGWAKGAPGRHLLSIFTDDTSTGNTALMGMLQTQVPNEYVFLAKDMTLAKLRTRAATFVLTTDVAHDELMQKFDWYALFLQVTALGSV